MSQGRSATGGDDPPHGAPLGDRGAVATEYVIVAAAVAAVVSVACSALAAQLSPLFQQAIALF